jgi:aminoglycoside phosphotransferase (APT) family kinase protein
VRVLATTPLTGGGFAAVHRVELSDGRQVVLKAGPAPGTRLLAYEAGMIAAEARYLRLAGPDVLDASPLPRLLGDGDGDGDGDGEWMITELLPGVSLASLCEEIADPAVAPGVREAVGAAMARIHGVASPTGVFGYDGGRPHGQSWGAAFAAIIASLLADAERWDVRLPVDGAQITGLISSCRDELDRVRRAALVHFDLWDGNVLCSPGAGGGWELTGLVDGERHLFGDPLVDFVSPALFRRIEDEPGHPFLRGYGRTAAFTDGELLRLALYRLHLYLLMVVEMPSRGMGEDTHARRGAELRALLSDAVEDVRGRLAARDREPAA